MNGQQIVFLTILIGTLLLFVTERVRIDIAALLSLLALTVTGILTPAEALSGFSSEPAIIVAAVFVIASALSATGITERIGEFVARAAGGSEWRATLVVMPTVAIFASVSHHLMVTAMMLPILMRLARDRELPASRLLMPMSLAASLGTTLTLFSAPAFLLANYLLRSGAQTELGLFSITPIGAALVGVGILYMSLGRWLLPRRGARADESDYLQLDLYYTEVVIEEGSRWIDRPIARLIAHFEGRLDVAEWIRNEVPQGHAAGDATLRAGDVLFVRASPDEIASIEREPGIALHAVAKYGDAPQADGTVDVEEHQLVQVLVAPRSEFVGKTIADINFLKTLGVVVIGLWRRDGWMRQEIADMPLEEGDVLVVRGTPRSFAQLADHRGFSMMVAFSGQERRRHRATFAICILGVTVAVAASGLLSAHVAFLMGALALVVTGCISVERAYHEIDVRIFVMIAGVIPLGLAMERSGTAAFFATYLEQITANWSSMAVLLALFWSAGLITQVLSDAATVVLLGPIALALALGLELPPQPFLVCTALGAVAAFLTPIGHHGNLLILGPGQYTFGDFLRVGVPLTVLISVLSAWIARWLWLGGSLLPF